MQLRSFIRYPGLTAVFTGVPDGDLTGSVDPVSAEAARTRLASRLGFPVTQLRRMSQVHSADVALVTAAPEHRTPVADALVDPGGSLVPMVLTADCVPVVLAAAGPEGAVMTAVAHAGRRGLLDGVLSACVHRLRELRAQEIEAWVGPSICGACYEVPQEMADDAEAARPGIAGRTTWGTASLDLPGAAVTELEGLGVLTHREDVCTLTDPVYHSYRGGDRVDRNGSLVLRLDPSHPEATRRSQPA
jgi:YfiH family protein